MRIGSDLVWRGLTTAVLAALLGIGWPAARTAAQAAPTGAPLTAEELAALAAQFDDEVLTGGQVPPRISRWVNDDVFVFLQLDNPDPAKATAIRYVGIGVKGVFCAETQPDRSFTHFHKYDAPEYAAGHGSQPGDQGYWLTWVAVDEFETRDGRHVTPGVDYAFSPTPPPSCGGNIPAVAFDPPAAGPLSHDEIVALAALFDSQILTGGQTPPRVHKWVNPRVTIFLQFDAANPAEATALRDVGITVPGTFCAESQPSADFPHFHQADAPEYAAGHGSAPGQVGYWLLWVAVDEFTTRDGRQVTPGVDRVFSPTPPPPCRGEDVAATPAAAVEIAGTEYAFDPATLRVAANSAVTVTFRNAGTIPHTLTVPVAGADTGAVAAGATATLRFTAPATPGRHEFLCAFGGHLEAGMVGTLLVV